MLIATHAAALDALAADADYRAALDVLAAVVTASAAADNRAAGFVDYWFKRADKKMEAIREAGETK